MEQNKLLWLLQVSQHKIIHHSREKSHNKFQIGRCLKHRSTFGFLKTQYPLSSFQQIMLKRLHSVKKKPKPKEPKPCIFLSDSHQEEGLFGGKQSRRAWQIGNFVWRALLIYITHFKYFPHLRVKLGCILSTLMWHMGFLFLWQEKWVSGLKILPLQLIHAPAPAQSWVQKYCCVAKRVGQIMPPECLWHGCKVRSGWCRAGPETPHPPAADLACH